MKHLTAQNHDQHIHDKYCGLIEGTTFPDKEWYEIAYILAETAASDPNGVPNLKNVCHVINLALFEFPTFRMIKGPEPFRVVIANGGGVYPHDAIQTIFPTHDPCPEDPGVTSQTDSPDIGALASQPGAPFGGLVCSGDTCEVNLATNGALSVTDTAIAHVGGPLGQKWIALQGAFGWLGAPTTDTSCGLTNHGCYQTFPTGKIHWAQATGAHFTRGRIQAKWGDLGWEKGFLGYPTSDENGGLKGSGCYQNFQGGKIYWTNATGAQPVKGSILSAWAQTGYENGWLGYPTSGENPSGDGIVQNFQGGWLFWSKATGVYGEGWPETTATGAAQPTLTDATTPAPATLTELRARRPD